MLDFMNPQRAGRWPRHLRRLARFVKPEGRRRPGFAMRHNLPRTMK
jgi:hypothetical protein